MLSAAGLRRPEDVVTWLGAVQAQEFEPATWALALRMRDGGTQADVQRAFDAGRILRTHVMRPTWHFVAATDIRWLQELTSPRVQRIAVVKPRGPPRWNKAGDCGAEKEQHDDGSECRGIH